MALQLNSSFSGIAVPDAYFRVEKMTIANAVVDAVVVMQTARDTTPINATSYSFPYDLSSGKNVNNQTYEYLKTLPAFAGAIDVLEPGQTA
jgi:hypothetical protein